MRAFVALDISPELRLRLRKLNRELRRLNLGGRFTRPETWHVTLKFLGKVKPDQLSAIEQALKSAATATKPFRLTCGEIGAFPRVDRPRVIWASITPGQSLLRLQQKVEQSLTALGLAAESRSFRPHLTLWRSKSLPRTAGWNDYLRNRGYGLKLGRFQVDRLYLFESCLAPGGSRYIKWASLVLGGS